MLYVRSYLSMARTNDVAACWCLDTTRVTFSVIFSSRIGRLIIHITEDNRGSDVTSSLEQSTNRILSSWKRSYLLDKWRCVYRVAQKIVSYCTLSISSLNIFAIFSPVDSAGNLLLTDMHITPTISLHYLVKQKYPKINNIIVAGCNFVGYGQV